MLTLLTLLACGTTETKDTGPLPTLTFLDPIDGDTVPVGEKTVSVIVENFALVDPAKHNEGEAEGYITVRLNGTEVLQTGATQFPVTFDTAGSATLEGELFFSDGDALDPAVVTSISLTVE